MNAKEKRTPMASPKPESGKSSASRARKLLSAKNVIRLAFAAVVVAAVFSTKVVSVAESIVDPRDIFNAESYTNKYFSTDIVPRIENKATDLATIVAAIEEDEEAAKLKYGNSDNPNNNYSYPVTFTGVAGAATGELKNADGTVSKTTIPLTVEGLPDDVVVEIPIELIKGTALRDVTGTVNLNQFLNQTEFLKVSQAFNAHVKKYVIDPFIEDNPLESLEGQAIEIVGAFIDNKNLDLVSVVPISLELAS